MTGVVIYDHEWSFDWWCKSIDCSGASQLSIYVSILQNTFINITKKVQKQKGYTRFFVMKKFFYSSNLKFHLARIGEWSWLLQSLLEAHDSLWEPIESLANPSKYQRFFCLPKSENSEQTLGTNPAVLSPSLLRMLWAAHDSPWEAALIGKSLLNNYQPCCSEWKQAESFNQMSF